MYSSGRRDVLLVLATLNGIHLSDGSAAVGFPSFSRYKFDTYGPEVLELVMWGRLRAESLLE